MSLSFTIRQTRILADIMGHFASNGSYLPSMYLFDTPEGEQFAYRVYRLHIDLDNVMNDYLKLKDGTYEERRVLFSVVRKLHTEIRDALKNPVFGR